MNNPSIEYEENGMHVEEFFSTYSEEEKQRNEVNSANASLVFTPKFIPYYPELAKLGLTDKAILLYGFIDFYINSAGVRFYFSNEQISKVINCSIDTCTEAIKQLETAGMIATSRKMKAGGGQIRFVQKVVHSGNSHRSSPDDPYYSNNNNKINTYAQNQQNGQQPFEQEFAEFWNQYPRKTAKTKAKQTYIKLIRKEKNVGGWAAQVLEGLARYKLYWEQRQTDKQYIPHPSTWLNAGQWEDELDNSKLISNLKRLS